MLPGTRPRKRRRGPFGPEVEKSCRATPSGRSPCRENPFARGAAQADRDLHLRRRSAISARPGSCRAAKTCARSGEGPERARVARGVYRHFSTSGAGQSATACTQRAATKRQLALNLGPSSLNLDTKNLLLQAVGASSVLSLRTRTPHGGGGELGVGGSARRGGAYDRTRVRTRVDAGAWQGLRRRFKAPSPSSRRT